MATNSELRSGDWVRVRSKEEILASLDKSAQLEKLPFMPEMFEFCGQRFRVFKRAHKTCDPPNGIGGRRMLNTVHLEGVRCSGDAHGGCQARCLLFWKEAWLTKIDEGAPAAALVRPQRTTNGVHEGRFPGCTEQDVVAGTLSPVGPAEASQPVFVCQSTQVAQATTPLPWWDVRQYVADYRSGNVRLSQLLSAFLFFLYAELASAGIGCGAAFRWIYDRLQKLRGGVQYPLRQGLIPRGEKTPAAKLDLAPGELVRVRSYQEILATLNEDSYNRGMYFDAEMVPYCGNTYRVLARVDRIINEKTGTMQYIKNDCIILEDVVCLACYAQNRRFCPRSIYPYWREIWLERVTQEQASRSETAAESLQVS
ncbi:MAG: hypothetical protein IT170_18840 [Bryobacterales bacterium]|nr:hypothetical protein [Bryobacterales bacterium]